jgi:signal transduction histidine kinase
MEVDAVLIKRLVCNLLSNAIDASPPGSEVQAHLAPLLTTDTTRGWYRLRIIDHGEGISAENLSRVFTPYFTTKNTGDGRRGFGLGLAIAHKIAHLHGGNLSITSKEKTGTIVQVDLPGKLSQGQNSSAQDSNPRLHMIPA